MTLARASSRAASALIALLASVLAGCAAPAPQAEPPPALPARTELAPSPESDLLAMASEIQVKVSRLRGLEFKRDVPKVIRDAAEIRRDFLEARLEDMMPEKKRVGDEKALGALGLLPPRTDLRRSFSTSSPSRSAATSIPGRRS